MSSFKLIRKYRTRLIAEVVTGKVDIRDIPVETAPKDEALEDFVETEEKEEVFDIVENWNDKRNSTQWVDNCHWRKRVARRVTNCRIQKATRRVMSLPGDFFPI